MVELCLYAALGNGMEISEPAKNILRNTTENRTEEIEITFLFVF